MEPVENITIGYFAGIDLNYLQDAFKSSIDRIAGLYPESVHNLEFLFSRSPVPPIYITYAIIISLAVAVVYFSSISTLERPDNALEPDRYSVLFHPSDLATSIVPDRVGQNDAYLMPIIGGGALLSIYFAFKYFDENVIQWLFNCYFSLVGQMALISVLSNGLKGFLRIAFNVALPHWRITQSVDPDYHQFGPQDPDAKAVDVVSKNQISNFYFSLGEVVGIPIAVVLGVVQYYTKNWIISNFIGASVAIMGIQMIRLDSFKTGFVLLTGLFFYDIFFVFFTDVMLTVATKLTVPVKLEIPRPLSVEEISQGIVVSKTAMLGLGDIVVPALFLSLCLRFDLWLYHSKHKELTFHLARPYTRTYFYWGLLAYTLGLITTVTVLHVFRAGQPALLYLCPAIATSTLLVAYFNDQLSLLWQYSEGKKEEKEEVKEKIKLEGDADGGDEEGEKTVQVELAEAQN